MKLSVVIVNYNVAYFLEQCLSSVYNSEVNFEFEVFVVDNNSVDNSLEMVKEKFPQVYLIANDFNAGFSKANNQAIRISKGEFVLLLNPDTLIQPDTLQKSVDFMENHPDAGGLGVMMVDGKGKFLPESKRGLPTPSAAFFKMFGLSALFPHHPKLSAYHLGHLDKNQTHEIDVLSGAYMLMRKETLDKVGLLDESYFMYGEDIDLSYRIQLGGYKNYYLPETRIIHYKGESTKKDSLNYVFVFYKAMIIFAKKHFSQRNARAFSILINMAIVFKAGLSILTGFFRKFLVAFIDFLLIYIGLFGFAAYWGPHFADQAHLYPPIFLNVFMPAYILLIMITSYYSGGYDNPLKLQKLIKGQLLGILLVFVFYALLPENFRFSRATLLFAAFYIPTISIIWRLALAGKRFNILELSSKITKRLVLIGGESEINRVNELLQKTAIKIERVISITSENISLNRLNETIKIHKINELVFCAKDMTSAEIIDIMTNLNHHHLDFKIAPPESLFIIGSNSINTSGEIYFQEVNSISKPENLRYKRLFDFAAALLLMLFFPLIFWTQKKPAKFLKNMLQTFFGIKSIVGFEFFT